MKWFTITGRFQAEDIDDALRFLADDFAAAAEGEQNRWSARLCEFDVGPEKDADANGGEGG